MISVDNRRIRDHQLIVAKELGVIRDIKAFLLAEERSIETSEITRGYILKRLSLLEKEEKAIKQRSAFLSHVEETVSIIRKDNEKMLDDAIRLIAKFE